LKTEGALSGHCDHSIIVDNRHGDFLIPTRLNTENLDRVDKVQMPRGGRFPPAPQYSGAPLKTLASKALEHKHNISTAPHRTAPKTTMFKKEYVHILSHHGHLPPTNPQLDSISAGAKSKVKSSVQRALRAKITET